MTRLEIIKAVADVEAAFAAAWKLAGGFIPPEELPRREDLSKEKASSDKAP